MKRRSFLGKLAMGPVVGSMLPSLSAPPSVGGTPRVASSDIRLAGMTLPELRKALHDELFGNILPFWDQHGVDHEYGGIMCSLDYDGTLKDTSKLLWFQGRALWVYSFLYNNFGKDPRHLEIARKTKDFVLKYGPQKDGWWAEVLTREGKVQKPFGGDIDGVYFVAEGLEEYSVATGDSVAAGMSVALLKKLFHYFNQPSYRYTGPDFPNLSNDASVRPQGTWMLNLQVATQLSKRHNDPELTAITDAAIDAVIHHHYNPEIGLNTEMLNFDFTRAHGEEKKSRIGHSVEVLWMIMTEADRRGETALWNLCAERIRRHLDCGWDRVYGGMSQWVNVDEGGYQWPAETPVGTGLEFHFVGEYNYMKTMWGMNEVMVACLKVFERTQAEWAAEYFALAYAVILEKFSQKSRGLPGYAIFTDRRFTIQSHVGRQDNYHPVRQLMLNLVTLDRMIQASQPSAAMRFADPGYAAMFGNSSLSPLASSQSEVQH
jgi:N-acylglucosamine 2-epimerase